MAAKLLLPFPLPARHSPPAAPQAPLPRRLPPALPARSAAAPPSPRPASLGGGAGRREAPQGDPLRPRDPARQEAQAGTQAPQHPRRAARPRHSLRDLGRFRRDLGLTRKRRLIALLKRFPGVFEFVEEGVYSLKFRLTPEAERIYLDELHLKNKSKGQAITKLGKLLMMSQDKRIFIEKIAHLKHDLGLPSEFRDTICPRYPQYFRIVRMDRGPGLELTHWDPQLAVSAAEVAEEENRVREAEERNLIIDRPLRFNRVKLPKGLKLSRERHGELHNSGKCHTFHHTPTSHICGLGRLRRRSMLAWLFMRF